MHKKAQRKSMRLPEPLVCIEPIKLKTPLRMPYLPIYSNLDTLNPKKTKILLEYEPVAACSKENNFFGPSLGTRVAQININQQVIPRKSVKSTRASVQNSVLLPLSSNNPNELSFNNQPIGMFRKELISPKILKFRQNRAMSADPKTRRLNSSQTRSRKEIESQNCEDSKDSRRQRAMSPFLFTFGVRDQ